MKSSLTRILNLQQALIVAFFFSSMVATAQSNQSKNICHNKTAQKLLGQPQNYAPLDHLQTFLVENDLVLFGEIHTSLPQIRGKLINLMVKNRTEKICLFYELSEKLSPLASLLKNKNHLYRETVQDLHQAARLNQMTELLVDSDVSSDYGGLLDATAVDTYPRDLAMAEKISEAYKSGLCQKGIFFVGTDHLFRDSEDGQTQKIVGLLKKRGHSLVTVKLQDVFDRTRFGFSDEISSWSRVCRAGAKLPMPVKPVLFQSSVLPQEVLHNPLPGTGEVSNIRFSQFDWILLAR